MTRFSNGIVTALDGLINASQTSVTVDDGNVFPSSGDFYVAVDDEIMKVTARSGNTLTVVRGQEGTTGASHLDNASIFSIITKAHFDNIPTERSLYNSYGSIPAFGNKGRLFLQTTGQMTSVDDGSKWNHYAFIHKLKPPVLGNYTWVNQNSTTVSDTGQLTITCPSDGNGFAMLLKTVPSAPYTFDLGYNFTAHMNPICYAGLILRNSGSGSLRFYGYARRSTTYEFVIHHYTNATTFSASAHASGTNQHAHALSKMALLRIYDDNTTTRYQSSSDGINWSTQFSHGRTTFITPDQIGFGCLRTTGTGSIYMTVYHNDQG